MGVPGRSGGGFVQHFVQHCGVSHSPLLAFVNHSKTLSTRRSHKTSHFVDRFVEWLLVGACNSVPVMKMPSDQNDGWLNSRRRSFAIFTPVLAPFALPAAKSNTNSNPYGQKNRTG